MMEPRSLRVGILTTDTPHHTRFVQAIAETWAVPCVFEEKREPSAMFETHHPFEDDRDAYEVESWFGGTPTHLRDVAEVQTFQDLNEDAAVEAMRKTGCDVHLVFGTGKLEQHVIDLTPDRIVNLHGADPEHYRGLDTHLWAVYHKDFRGLVTTLHKVSPQIDRGGVVMKMPIPLERGMELYQLRKANTEICIEIANRGLEMMANYGQFISQPQLYIGRHYSFMPAVLKERCVRQFAAFTATL
jgi:methionyl-tRNA formyltransferase